MTAIDTTGREKVAVGIRLPTGEYHEITEAIEALGGFLTVPQFLRQAAVEKARAVLAERGEVR